ncbi:ABC transporter substrate-binding protein [Cytobacillus sp. FJAT-53684]|uniref:ABC transporter substrate-binding protein n=1 Tax=Cytobacillus mangrovibacter TaxID=3299024 RepID=A0ABW6JT83_9BACI
MTFKRGYLRIIFYALLIMLMSLVVGCTSEQTSKQNLDEDQTSDVINDDGSPKEGGAITVALVSEPDTLDAHKFSNGRACQVLELLGGGLFTFDPETEEYLPYLAEDYTISDDGKTWTFKLRTGINFHDGTPLTADVYKQTFERILNPETQSTLALVGLPPLESVSAPDDETLVLETTEPTASLITALTGCFYQPLSMEAVNKYGNDYGRNPVGIGPWVFQDWETGQSITLVRNEEFQWPAPWSENDGPSYPEKLTFRFIENSQTMLAALDSGSIDIAHDVPALDVEQKYRNNPDFEVLEQPIAGLGLAIWMNMKNEVFQDIEVRQALNMAIHKEAMIQAVFQGAAEIAYGPMSQSVLGYDKAVEEYGYKYSVEEAKQLLDSAGWKENQNGIRERNGEKLSLNLVTRQSYDRQSQLIQEMLSEIGIEVTIQNLEPTAHITAAVAGEYDITLLGYRGADPNSLYGFFHTGEAFNLPKLSDESLDSLLEKGAETIDLEQRNQIYAEIQKHIVENAYMVPLYTESNFTVINNRVHGVIKYQGEWLRFYDAWIE